MRNFLDLNKVSRRALVEIIEKAKKMKIARNGLKSGALDRDTYLDGYVVGLIFEKPSTRTRVSFDVGVRQLGGQPILLSSADLQLSNGECIADTARVLSRYLDMVMIRTFEEKTLSDMAKFSTIPVINGLTNRSHPCQVMADIMTFEEARGPIAGKKVVWVGDGNNVCLSYLHASTKFEFELVVTSPEDFEPSRADVLAETEAGANLTIESNPFKAVVDADLVVTDTYFSMHNSAEDSDQKLELFKDYQVNRALLNKASDKVVFLHCLPAYRDLEVTSNVIDGKNSLVFDAAENRLHVQKAIMKWCVDG